MGYNPNDFGLHSLPVVPLQLPIMGFQTGSSSIMGGGKPIWLKITTWRTLSTTGWKSPNILACGCSYSFFWTLCVLIIMTSSLLGLLVVQTPESYRVTALQVGKSLLIWVGRCIFCRLRTLN